jgi:two-component system NtrC family sensor kinase
MAIAADIKQNLEKIIHHGKRADAIVKNMLQHSRSNSGEKQPTDINALADEYLRLSYHGLRAKDKMFNSSMITEFDPVLPKVNVISQDIGRVLLNLFNNAFYAVQQRHNQVGDTYKPEVSVSTKLITSASGVRKIEIKVTDNGTGIPDDVKGKILQPFFTTKPTGEGTGLGLSLSYDIVVKGHGGTIDIESKEGEKTAFTIQIPA